MRRKGFTQISLVLWFISVSFLRAQTPACGSTITTDTTFDADMICPLALPGAALIIGASGITVDGAGFQIDAPEIVLRPE